MSVYIGPNAKVYDSARICDSARVYGSALVTGSAWVYGSAEVYGAALVSGRGDIAHTRHWLTVGPLGSANRAMTIHRHYDGPDTDTWGHLVIAGCWSGTLNQLAARIAGDDHGWTPDQAAQWRADYEAAITYARIRVSEWEAEPVTAADHARWAARMDGAA